MAHRLILNKEAPMDWFDVEWWQNLDWWKIGLQASISFFIALILILVRHIMRRDLRERLKVLKDLVDTLIDESIVPMRQDIKTLTANLEAMKKLTETAEQNATAAHKKYEDLMASIHRSEEDLREALETLKKLKGS